MKLEVEILAHSMLANDLEVATFRLRYPLVYHAQRLKHGLLRGSAVSTRAVTAERYANTFAEPAYVPPEWSTEQRGMTGGEPLVEYKAKAARAHWLAAEEAAKAAHAELTKLGVHKQLANRLLAPFAYIEEVVTGPIWAWLHFIERRIASDAQPEMQFLAELVKAAIEESTPRKLRPLDWHIPYAAPDDSALTREDRLTVAAARCARASYGRHGSHDINIENDLRLAKFLEREKHATPFEHIVTACHAPDGIPQYGGMAVTLRDSLGIDTAKQLQAAHGGKHA